MASRAQLEQMRRALPSGGQHAPQVPTGMPTMPTGGSDQADESDGNRGGMYL
jgi:hypothetical protein